MNAQPLINIAIVDDHAITREGLNLLLHALNAYKVIIEAVDGEDLLRKLANGAKKPDICVVDINMTPMDGFETTKRLKELYPEIKVLALSMLDEGFSVRKMLSNGAKGFLHKNTSAEELDQALKTIYSGAYFHSGLVSDDVLERAMSLYPLSISNRETEFLALCCTELAYKQIAEQMQISMHTVEGYRKQLFQKLNVKNRTSLAIYALKTGIASF